MMVHFRKQLNNNMLEGINKLIIPRKNNTKLGDYDSDRDVGIQLLGAKIKTRGRR